MKMKKILSVALILPILAANSALAWENHHGHGERGYYNYGRGGYYGGGWNYGPNVIIQVPTTPYYETVPAPVCDRVEVCNNYGNCWIERRCE